jgi:uncharacterized protein (DUF4415 family)
MYTPSVRFERDERKERQRNMSGKPTKMQSRTDWERVDALTDEEIDTSDIPPLDEAFFAGAELQMPQAKPSITIRLDPDILELFKSQGKGYQTRINAVLRRYVEAQEK